MSNKCPQAVELPLDYFACQKPSPSHARESDFWHYQFFHGRDYSCRVSPLREPMPTEPSRTNWMDGEGSTAAGAAGDSGTAGGVWSSVTFSRNVADGTKNKFPVTARLKSSSRS